MRVHHLNCGTMCPRGGRLLGGAGRPLATARLVAHCLLIEAGGELVLVDTGFGTEDIARPKRLGQPFRALVRPQPGPKRPPCGRSRRSASTPGTCATSWPPTSTSTTPAAWATSRRRRCTCSPRSWRSHSPRPRASAPATSRHTGRMARAGCSTRWTARTGSASRACGCCPASAQAVVGHDNATPHRNEERLRELARRHGSEVRLMGSHDVSEFDREVAAVP